MKKKDERKGIMELLRTSRLAQLLVLAALAFLLLQLGKMNEYNSFFWLSRPQLHEIYITDYPKLVSGASQFSAYSTDEVSCALCGSPVSLHAGENPLQFNPGSCSGLVRLDCGDRNLSFSFASAADLPRESVAADVSSEVENRTLWLHISGAGTANGYHQLQISIDGNVVSRPLHMLNGTFSFTESVPAPAGRHSYAVTYNGEAAGSGTFDEPSPFSLSALLTTLLCVVLAIVWKRDSTTRLLTLIPLLVASLVVDFRLGEAGFGFVAPAALALAVAYCHFAREKRPAADAGAGLAKEALIFGAAFAAFILLVNILIANYDIWGAYYFRQAEATLEHGTTAYWDSLSYLGRPFTYPPVFFEFAAQATRSLGFIANSYEDIRVPLNLLMSFAYATSLYLVFRKLPFSQRLVAAAFLATLWATLMESAGIGIQVLAFALMNCAVALMGTETAIAAVSLGIGFAAHPLALVFFPFLAFAANGFKVERRLILSGLLIAAAAVIISLPFYIPIFLRAGLPYEIVPQRWGYLLTYGIDGIRFSLNFLFPLSLATIAYAIYRRKHVLPALFLLALMLAAAFISMRADVTAAITAAGLAPLVFERELRDRRFLLLLLLAYLVPNLLLGAVVMNGTNYHCTWGLANDVCSSPMEYLATYSPASAAVATNPIYGHLEAYLGKRPVLADLYVEYADEAKFRAEDGFYWQGNISGLSAYGITYAVLDDYYLHPRSAPGDRIYDNGYMHAFRVR